MRRSLLAAVAAALLAPAPAQADDPTMALADVRPGARCTALTVVRGTEVTSFDVEVLDVLDRERPESARILVRVWGPAVDATGLGPGFSGSPIYCPDADGVVRNIGALSETVGEYGGKTAVATPIERILAQPTLPPPALQRTIIGSRSLAGPLTITGLRSSLATLFVRAARKAGRVLIASPAATRAAFPPQPLVPGAAVSVGLTSGAIAVGSLGTVSYVRGAEVWIFGHPLDGAGRRSLFLQDAFVHTVVNNPIAVPDVATYKLGAAGNDVGTVTSDGDGAVAGIVGAPAPSFPLRVTARDLDPPGRVRSYLTKIADEVDVGLPAGVSPLGLSASAAVGEAAAAVLTGSPARQSGDMCVRFTLRELPEPLRFCNSYAVNGTGPNALAGDVATDMVSAVAIIDSYRFGTLHPTGIDVGLRVKRGLSQAFIDRVSARRVVHRGQRIAVRMRLRHAGSGNLTTRTIRVRIPFDTPTGNRTLRLTGTTADVGSALADEGDLSLLFEAKDTGTDDPGPKSLKELRRAFEDLGRFDGVSVKVGSGGDREVYRHPDMRITGQAGVDLVVRR